MKVDWLKMRSDISPHHIAVTDIESHYNYTYAEMNQRAAALANFLAEKDIEKGDRVALFAPNHIAYLDVYFACTKLGAIFVPVNWRLKAPEIDKIMKDAAPKAVIYSTFKEKRIKTIPEEKLVLCLDDREVYEKTLNEYNYSFSSDVEVTVSDLAMLVYTSGTTGQPKGVEIPHRMIIANAVNTITTWQLNETHRTITLSPMFHIAGLTCFLFPLLLIGGRAIIIKFFDYDSLSDMIDYYQVTHIFMVPTMYINWIGNETFAPEKLDSIELFISGGAAPSKRVHETFVRNNLPLVNSYGLSEAGSNNFYIEPKAAQDDFESIGKPIMFCDVQLLDEKGKVVREGEVGELTIAGAHIFDGYWNKTEATASTLINDRVHTGDLAYVNEEGNYYIVGRIKDLIVTCGENVYASEVENLLLEHKQVKNCAVVGIPNEDYGEIVVAAIVPDSKDLNRLKRELVLLANEKLANYKAPKKYVFLDQLPETSVGKVNKKALLRNNKSLK